MAVIGHAVEVLIVAANVVELVEAVNAVPNVEANVEPIGVEVVSTTVKKGKLAVFSKLICKLAIRGKLGFAN